MCCGAVPCAVCVVRLLVGAGCKLLLLVFCSLFDARWLVLVVSCLVFVV